MNAKEFCAIPQATIWCLHKEQVESSESCRTKTFTIQISK